MTLPQGRAAIARLIPHQGSMCLLDRVITCDARGIACAATSHRDAANPLRRGGLLPAVCGVEYALQAMALHGALTDAAPQGAGYLAALAGVGIGAGRLDDIAAELTVTAIALSRESRGFIYSFAVADGERRLLEGRATVMLA